LRFEEKAAGKRLTKIKQSDIIYNIRFMKGTKDMFTAIVSTVFTYFFFSFGFYWSGCFGRVHKMNVKRYCS